jgi:hypothetical protein
MPGQWPVGNLWVRRRSGAGGVATSLLAEAGRWLRVAGRTALLTHLSEESPESERLFYEAADFEVLTRTRRDWTRS